MYEPCIYNAIVQTYHIHGTYMFILFMKCINMYIPVCTKFLIMYIHGIYMFIHFNVYTMYVHGIYVVQMCIYMFIQI